MPCAVNVKCSLRQFSEFIIIIRTGVVCKIYAREGSKPMIIFIFKAGERRRETNMTHGGQAAGTDQITGASMVLY